MVDVVARRGGAGLTGMLANIPALATIRSPPTDKVISPSKM
jgi:hypothetical protein